MDNLHILCAHKTTKSNLIEMKVDIQALTLALSLRNLEDTRRDTPIRSAPIKKPRRVAQAGFWIQALTDLRQRQIRTSGARQY